MLALNGLALVAWALAVCQTRVESTAAPPAWASELVLVDPAQVFQEDVWSMVLPNLSNEREAIFQKMSSGRLTEAVQHARELISRLARHGNRPEMLLFKQTIFMLKIKAEAMNRQYLEALLDGARFSSFCAGLPKGCPNTKPIELLVKQLEEKLLALEDQTEILGLTGDELTDLAKLKKSQAKTMHMLHQRQNAYMDLEHQKYVKILYDWAESVYKQLFEYAARIQAEVKPEPRYERRSSGPWTNLFCRPSSSAHVSPGAKTDTGRSSGTRSNPFLGKAFSWTKSPKSNSPESSPSPPPTPPPPAATAAQPVRPARRTTQIDPALIEMRNAIENKLNTNQLSECIELSKSLIDKLNNELGNQPDLADFRYSVFVLKIKAEVKSRQYVQALLDCARLISHCTKVSGSCPQVHIVHQMRDQIEKSLESVGPEEFLGLSASDSRDRQALKRGQKEARLLLHPDRNRDLDEEQQRYVGALFDRANRAYSDLLTSPGMG